MLGIDVDRQPREMQCLSHERQMELAGNMMDGNTVVSCLLAMYCVLPLADAALLMAEHVEGSAQVDQSQKAVIERPASPVGGAACVEDKVIR